MEAILLPILAFLPILVCLVLMMAFNIPAKISLPVAWTLACIFGLIFWKMGWLSVLAYSLSGMLNSIDVLVTITGAIIVMDILKESGGMYSINNGFKSISSDARIQAIIVGWMFSSFIEGAVGNMICVNNTVAVCATVGTNGKEGKIIRVTITPTAIYTVFIVIIFVFLIFVFHVGIA